jgi:hypothetical protein
LPARLVRTRLKVPGSPGAPSRRACSTCAEVVIRLTHRDMPYLVGRLLEKRAGKPGTYIPYWNE